MKLKHLLAVALMAIGGSAWAQTDVTGTYLTNADFESGTITFDKTHGATAQTSRTGSDNKKDGWIYLPQGWSNASVLNNNAVQIATAEFGLTTNVANGLNNTCPPATDNNGNTGACLGISAGWGDDAIIYQEKELPAGAYTFSWYTYNAHTNNSIAENFSGVKIGDKTVYSTLKTLAKSSGWTKESVSFHLLQATTVRFQIGYTTSTGGSSNGAKLYVDNMKLEAILPDVYTNLSNLNFADGAIASGNIATYAKDGSVAQMQPVPEWFMAIDNGDARAAGVAAYGSGVTYGGNGYPVPSTGPTGTNGKALGFVGVWTGTVQYIKPIKFLAGSYDITIPVYNQAGTSAFTKNLIGFVETDGTEHLLSATSYTVGQWTTETIKLNFDVDTYGYLSVGYQGSNVGSSAAQHLFVDAINITGKSLLEGKKELANDNVTEATPLLSQKQYSGTKSALQTAIDNINNMSASITLDEVNGLISALATAKTNAEASIADYALLNTNITYAEAYTPVKPGVTDYADAIQAAKDAYNNGTVETCAATIKSLTDYKVADDAYVTSTYQYGVTLGDWTTTGFTANFNNEHWSGTTRNYKNQDDSNGRGYNSNSGFEISFSQNVTLPAGSYVFKVAGRKSADATLAMVVKKGEDVLGNVSNFPVGNVGLGINKSGVASFDAEDAAGFAGNTGKGWQWRFVKFDLTEESEVTIAVNASASTRYQWISFGDYTLQTDNEANISMIAYNIAKNDATLAITNDGELVVGSEKTTLQNAIDAAPGSTKAEIEAATANLATLKTAFVDAKPSYTDLVRAKEEAAAEKYGKELPYASATKFAAIATAVNVTPTSAADAVTKAAAIRTAYRAYIESNAMAEGVDGAVDMTSLITNPNFETDLAGWTSSQSGGSLVKRSNESPTTSDGKSDWGYYDYNNNGSNNQHAEQTIENLPAGQYIVTISARAVSTLNPVRVWAVDVNASGKFVSIDRIGNTGGAFGRGWNDYTVVINNDKTQNVKIGVQTDASFGSGNKSGWFGFTRVRLVKIADAATMAVNAAAQYGTFCAPFDVTVPDGVEASTATIDSDGETIVLTSVGTTIPANTPVVLYGESLAENLAQTFYGVSVDGTPEAGVLTGVYERTTAEDGWYILQNHDGHVAFFLVDTKEDTPSVPANRAYLTVPSAAKPRMLRFGGDEETAISAVEALVSGKAEIYSVNGVKLNKLQKGINIVNGKKIMVK